MLSDWVEAGQDPAIFWRQTFASFNAVRKGAAKRIEGEIEREISLAWHTASFTAQAQSKKGLKPLRSILKKPPHKMSNAEMLANMRMLAANVNRKFEG